MFNGITFLHKEYLWFLLVIIPLTVWYILRLKKANPSLHISTAQAFKTIKPGLKVRLRHSLFFLRMIVLACLILIIARPQSRSTWQTSTTEGIDIMLAMDISGSMLAEDLKPNRIEAAKDVAIRFISNRPNDRIGLVIFAGESFTQCPLTTDHAVLINLFKDVKHDMLTDGTAIGSGLATSVNRLRESNAISKVIVLLTDGENNTGVVAPLTAAEIAKTFGMRVYTIGVGRKGTAPFPYKTPFGTQYHNIEVKIDEEMLQEIADLTGGKYYRAENTDMLKSIYTEIDQLEKTKLQVTNYSKPEERFFWLMIIALIALSLEILLRLTVYRPMP